MKKNIEKIIFLFVGTLLGAGANFLLQFYLAREFTLYDYGLYTSILNITNLLTPLIGFGIASFILKTYMVEGVSAKRWMGKIYQVIIVNALIVFLLLQIFAWLSGKTFERFHIFTFLFVYMMGLSLNGFVITRLQVEDKIRTLSIWQLIPNTLKLIFVILGLVILGESILALSIGYLLTGIVVLLFSFNSIIKLKEGSLKLKEKVSTEKRPAVTGMELMKNAFPYGLTGIFYLIYIQSSILILSFMKGYEDVAYLGLSLIFLTALCLLPSLFFQKIYMTKIHFWSKNNLIKMEEFHNYAKKQWLALGLVMMAVYIFFIKYYFIDLFGDKYLGNKAVFYLIALLGLVKYFSLNSGAVMSTENLIKDKSKCMSFAAIFNIVLSIPLVYWFGVYGSLLSLILIELYICFYFNREIKEKYGF